MDERNEKILSLSEPAAWDRFAPPIPTTYRYSRYTRAAFHSGFTAGLAFARAAFEGQEKP